MHKKGISRFSVENFLSHSAEKLLRGTYLGFKKFLVSKCFMDKRDGGRGCHGIVEKSFVLKDRKEKLGKEPFYFPGNFWHRKNFIGRREGGGGAVITIFHRDTFCLTVPKKLLREPFRVSESFWYRDNFIHK